MGKACYHSVQNILSSHFLSKTLNIKIYRTIILSAVCMGVDTLSLGLNKEHILSVFEKKVWRRNLNLRERKE
jgi:hypothetical protein